MEFSNLKRRLIPEFPTKGGKGKDAASEFHYDRIWRWAVLATSSVSIIPLILLGAWNLFQYQRAFKAEIMFPVHNLVFNGKSSLLLFLDERKSALKFIAYDNTFPALASSQRLGEIFTHLKESLGDIVDLGVITSDGVQVAYVGPYRLQSVNYQNERWFKEVLLRGEYISDVFLGFRDFPHLVIAIRQEIQNGDFFILRLTLDTQKFNSLVQSLSLREGQSDVFLINPEGLIQTPSRYHGKVLEKIKFTLPPAVLQSEVSELRDSNGQKVIIGHIRVENTPFTLVVVKPRRQLLHDLEVFAGQLIGFLAVAIFFILIVILRISTLMVNSIQEADRKRLQVLHEIEYTAKMASIGRLAAGVAHEINNPLAIINEKAGMIKDLSLSLPDLPRKEQFLNLAQSILNSVKRCSVITNRLLGFARHIDVQIEPIDLYPLLEETLGFLGKEAEYRNIEVTLQQGPEVPVLQSDRSQLQQVFLNIINNAFAAVSEKGKIDIHIQREGPDAVAVSIADNGIGIRKEDLDRIFEPFFTTKGRKGTGLGLSITYGIVRKLGGRIEVESEVNRGTKFTVILPLAKLG